MKLILIMETNVKEKEVVLSSVSGNDLKVTITNNSSSVYSVSQKFDHGELNNSKSTTKTPLSKGQSSVLYGDAIGAGVNMRIVLNSEDRNCEESFAVEVATPVNKTNYVKAIESPRPFNPVSGGFSDVDEKSKVYDSDTPYTVKGRDREVVVKISGRKPTESTIVINDIQ